MLFMYTDLNSICDVTIQHSNPTNSAVVGNSNRTNTVVSCGRNLNRLLLYTTTAAQIKLPKNYNCLS